MDKSSKEILESKMKLLRSSYIDQLYERISKLEHLYNLCEQKALSEQDRTELLSQAHKLSGSGATYGFITISESAKALEEQIIDHSTADAIYFMAATRQLIIACQKAIQTKSISEKLVEESIKPITDQTNSLPLLLIVDDDENIRNILQALFEDKARIIACENTKDAIELIKFHMPDLIILDDMMPGGVSGLQMLEDRQLMSEIKDIPVIMITASDKPEEVMRGLVAGASDYISKPFNLTEVSTKILGRLKRQNSYILIADDDQSVRELLEHKFQMAGCKVICVDDGEKAWELIQNKNFALIILDRMMPGYDGMTLLRMMSEDEKLAKIPVMFLTARHYGADVLEGLNMGAADYVTKPFNPDEVVVRSLRLINSN